MAYSTNILPKAAAYYTLSNATITGSTLELSSGGFAEIQVSKQMLPKLTSKMLIVVHPSVFSDSYSNDSVQVSLSIITASGRHIEYIIPVSYDPSGVFNTEINFVDDATSVLDEDYVVFTYRLVSSVPVSIYNWELCAEESSDMTAVIEGVEQEIPKLLYDYNTYAYAVAQKELTVGLITCYLLDKTSLQGHFTLSFFATERCNVHVRIKDNGVTELFSPQVYTVEKGYASISIPHAYLNKLATDHAFSVSVQCTNGQLSIPVRGLLYTIDGGYLATRLLDAGIDIQDISIRQVPSDQIPSEIWAIGYEGDRMLLKKRIYDNAQRGTWQAVKDFGEANGAAVEFKGDWIGRGREWKYTIETESTPYVFIVDTDNNLLVYSGTSFDEVKTIDSNITKVSACQGFNSMLYPEQDQGLVIAYLKSGNVYYRQLIRTSSSWTPAQPLYEGGDAISVSTHRLPDYRLGICVEYPGGTRWYITDRTYVNQAVKPEILDTRTDQTVVATLYKANEAPSQLLISGTTGSLEEVVYHNYFTVSFGYPIKLLNNKTTHDLKNAISVQSGNTFIPVREVTIQDDTVTVWFSEPVRGGVYLSVRHNSLWLAAVVDNGCYAALNQSYTVYLSLPTLRSTVLEDKEISIKAQLSVRVEPILVKRLNATDEVLLSNVTGSLQATVLPVLTKHRATSDTFDVSVSAEVSAVVAQVGISPI